MKTTVSWLLYVLSSQISLETKAQTQFKLSETTNNGENYEIFIPVN